MGGMSSSLPTPDERGWLLEQLARLVNARGPGPLVRAPLLTPSPRFFPDPWRPNEDGALLMARRLLGYAGMEDFDVHLSLFDNETPRFPDSPEPSSFKAVAGCFHGFEGRCCLFSVEAAELASPERLVGVLAHEVAHAYRAHHGLVVEDSEVEERLTDLTTVYLGFGVLTLNNAHRFETGSSIQGSRVTGYWRHSRLGYLPTQALAFLLAAQAVARRLEGKPRRELVAALGVNQASDFRAALALLEKEPEALARELHVPPPAAWPEPVDLARLTRPIGTLAPEPRLNEGQPVFRVREHLGVHLGLAGVLAALPLASGGLPQFAEAGLLQRGLALWSLVALGVLIGRRISRYRCSEPRCGARLKPADAECASCGGYVAGVLRDAREAQKVRQAVEMSRSHRGGSDYLN